MARPKKTTKPEVPSRPSVPETPSAKGAIAEGGLPFPDDLVVEVPGTSPLGFNVYDPDLGRVVVLSLRPGKQSVPRALFETFEADEFFRVNVLDADLVRVVSRPARSVDVVDI